MLHTKQQGGVLTATIDHPPVNLITVELLGALAALAHDVAADPEVRVLVLESANPDFFIAHFDVEALLEPVAAEVGRPNGFQRLTERFRTMDTVTIAKVAGRVGGGGAELASSFDMRFGAVGHTVINQMEVPLGILPGGSGTQRLPRLVGTGRALEIVLGADDLDAVTAEKWGWLNRALAPGELDAFVDRLARRIAGFPAGAVASAKASVLLAGDDLTAGLTEESRRFSELVVTPEAKARMEAFLAHGGQTAEGELRVGELSTELGPAPGD